MLIRDYYSIDSVVKTEAGAEFSVSLNPDCEVYRGHFPSKPICPGVCNINMLAECAEEVAGKRFGIKEIRRCRLSSLVVPGKKLKVVIALSGLPAEAEAQPVYSLKGEIFEGETSCLTLDCSLVER